MLFKRSPACTNLFKGIFMRLPSIKHILTHAFIHSFKSMGKSTMQKMRLLTELEENFLMIVFAVHNMVKML